MATPPFPNPHGGRRDFLRRFALGAAAFAAPGAFAEALVRTPKQTEGPFYPDRLPLDTDNDLLVLNNSLTPAVGEVAWLSGRILDEHGDPVRNALVEIWQADANGVYIHSKSGNAARRDGNFQGFGRFLTGASGEYLFRTIKPVPYKPRTPHIHLAVRIKGRKELITQCYVKGQPMNASDMVYKAIKDPAQRESVTLAFDPLKGSKAGELAARWDVVLGFTPEG
ncbi:MAG: intradiol ring-cleavage dioxygenase [Opitutales bacterium]|jgi:protocatechuate 3,4-dioxygenase beta subunit